MFTTSFLRASAVSALKLGLLFVVQFGLSESFSAFGFKAFGFDSCLVRTGVFALCAWLLEVGPARRAAAQDRARTEVLVEAMLSAEVMLDGQGRISSLNTAAEILLLRKQEDLRGRCIHTIEGLEELSKLCGCLGERPAHRSGRFVYANSVEGPAVVDWMTTPLPLEAGGGSVLSMRDVTAEVRALERAQLQAAALDTAANFIYIIDTQRRIEWVNTAFKRVTGYGDEVLGQTPAVLRSGKHEESFYAQMWETLDRGEAWVGEVISRRRDGSLFTCLSTVTPVSVVGRQATHYVVVAQDISQQRDLEKRLAVSERMASLGTLAAGLAHEINNPLSFITANLEYALTYLHSGEGDRDEAIAALGDASMGAQRVRKIVRSLKSFSRVGEGPCQPVDVRGALEQALTIAGSQLKGHAKVTVEVSDTPAVRADEGKLSQVFLNLLVNAAQAIPPGAPGTNEVKVVSSVTPRGEVVVEVSDTGCGLSESARKHLFEPFFTTKPVGVGTGLGLYICRNLIDNMGGELSVESVEGRGTTFRVQLPAAESMPALMAHAA